MGKNSPASAHLPDIQKTKDTRNVPLKKVGVSGIKIPILTYEKSRTKGSRFARQQHTIGVVDMHVFLPAERKGTHMSRFTELLNEHTASQKTFSMEDLIPLAEEMLDFLDTDQAFLRVQMDYFLEVFSPETKIRGVAPYKAELQIQAMRSASANRPNDVRIWTGVEVTGQTCCPCSKEISDYDPISQMGKGAHSQHGHVNIMVENEASAIIWFEDLIEIANRSVSHAAYPILKRVDERHATIGAYTNPKFVEDVLRDATIQLRDLDGVLWFRVKVENDEVIHFHKATGEVEESKQKH